MPRALFLLDEKRVAQGKKEAMTLDQLVDDLGIEEALKAWDTASPSPDHKAVEAELRHLAAVLKAACRGVRDADGDAAGGDGEHARFQCDVPQK